MDIRIYVMTHKKIAAIPDPMYIPMQVGKAGKEDFGYLGDDTGDNISEKNSAYCELTGMYWLWKNADCDVIGICHYRRYFTRNEKLLDKSYIEELMKEYSMIIPNSACVKDEDVYDHYRKRHYTKDLDLCREVIAEKYPEYTAAYDYCMRTILVSAGNMWITRKRIFDNYCTWLFDILFEVEKRMDLTGYDDYQGRVMGFLSERLFRVWLMMQKEPITEEYVKMIAPEDFGNADKRRDLLYRYIKLKIQPVIQLHQAKIETQTLASPISCDDDFEGKTPVWLCWWQGEAEMPELVRLCVESIRKNLPKEKTALRLITLENCMEYVTFTDTVLRKFNEGKISLTHLSDILRAELLYRYGGMWIDATYYVSSPLPEKLFERGLYTVRFEKLIWSSDITKGRWSGNFWITEKGHELFQFLMESLWYYWEQEEELVDYFLIDYILAAAVEEVEGVNEQLEQCGFYQGDVFGLSKWMNRRYKPEYVEWLKQKSEFYKLNRRENYSKKNIAGELTVYGYLVESMESE